MILMCTRVIYLVSQTDLVLDIHLFLSFELDARLALLHGGLNVVHVGLVVFLDADASGIERELLLFFEAAVVVVTHHGFEGT